MRGKCFFLFLFILPFFFFLISLRQTWEDLGLGPGEEREGGGDHRFDSEPAWGGGRIPSVHSRLVWGIGGHEVMRNRGLAWLRGHQLESEKLPVYRYKRQAHRQILIGTE